MTRKKNQESSISPKYSSHKNVTVKFDEDFAEEIKLTSKPNNSNIDTNSE